MDGMPARQFEPWVVLGLRRRCSEPRCETDWKRSAVEKISYIDRPDYKIADLAALNRQRRLTVIQQSLIRP
jgi:hypothetical protein